MTVCLVYPYLTLCSRLSLRLSSMRPYIHFLLSDSGPDDPITQPTNRGNKMRANAKYVREGALGYIHPEELFKQVGFSFLIFSFSSLYFPISFDKITVCAGHEHAG